MKDPKILHIIKYMGSKRNIWKFIVKAINEIYIDGKIYDIFSGSGTLAAALKNTYPLVANDIQEYSAILSKLYLDSYHWEQYPEEILDRIISTAEQYVNQINREYPDFAISYRNINSLDEFNQIESKQRELINFDFKENEYHLFIKYYSGTYWSFEQCLWIDAFIKSAQDYKNTPLFNVIISSLMFAMAYNSQSTGHYAQYREAGDEKSMKDILIYRRKKILPLFKKKFVELKNSLGQSKFVHEVTTLDYIECLKKMEPGSLVYADPPYCFVHYSRFYHALETLVRYDYPKLEYKGRYRSDRHQSPFCQKQNVKTSFLNMFEIINRKKSQLILSYSNSAMISFEELLQLANDSFDNNYVIVKRYLNHEHSTMGRKNDKTRSVKECLLIAKFKPRT